MTELCRHLAPLLAAELARGNSVAATGDGWGEKLRVDLARPLAPTPDELARAAWCVEGYAEGSPFDGFGPGWFCHRCAQRLHGPMGSESYRLAGAGPVARFIGRAVRFIFRRS